MGSRPPEADSLWEYVRGQGFEVVIYDRNVESKEKKVDSTLVVAGMDAIWSMDPGAFCLVAGDSDYEPVKEKSLSILWMLIIKLLHMLAVILGKVMYLKYLMAKQSKNGVIDVQIVDCFVSLKLFGW
ncbi:10072_t:CDS:2 [Ambispora gerdemannii]|uniref:10072_t:CDS:1 n=1 Tax=Ambispora gerdemannii TaxID=144530 RepID=A0A9N8W8E7_9GLOM|nr:10072_t:CDS:2 [Ambispora gerdemannii]